MARTNDKGYRTKIKIIILLPSLDGNSLKSEKESELLVGYFCK